MELQESHEPQVHGLEWEELLFGSEPRWTLEPEIAAIKQTVQSLRPSNTVTVTFLTQGGFNKIYNVSIDGEMFIMRVALPVDPRYKTMSEVATMDWVRRITNLPIPRIIAYQPSRYNLIGFEWMLMTKMPGKPFAEVCRFLPFAAKARLVRKLAAISACLFRNQLSGIGNIYGDYSVVEHSTSSEQIPPPIELANTKTSVLAKESGSDDGSAPTRKNSGASLFDLPDGASSEATLPDVGRIVSMKFFWKSHIHQDVHRGPFRSSKDWITACLSFDENDCYSALDKHSGGDLDSDAEEEVENATRTLPIIDKLRSLLPLVLTTDDDDPEPSMIFHHDLSRHNILVDDSGELTGLLDWECVSAVPVWKACNYPTFLEGRPRRSEPNPGRYTPEANGETSETYFENLWEHEATLLRDVFIDEMRNLDAGWMEVFDKSEVKRDFDCAVQECDSVISAKSIDAWIGDISAGISNPRNLHHRMYCLDGLPS
ncbi:Aminoglycoside phosphotransferase [Penicillium expansum]|nr:Aminoglycoside phosphotransferase [Penicillium expansum]